MIFIKIKETPAKGGTLHSYDLPFFENAQNKNSIHIISLSVDILHFAGSPPILFVFFREQGWWTSACPVGWQSDNEVIRDCQPLLTS